MNQLVLRSLDGAAVPVSVERVQGFRESLHGDLLTAASPGYDEARTPWNAMIDRRPGLIARCADAGDVARSVDFARDHHLLVSVRGGGHNIAGSSVCQDGLMIDLSPMKAVTVDAERRRARAEPGCSLGDFDRRSTAEGLATPLGINSTTGIAGLTLGGGFGWLTRRHGMTVDNLVSAEVVTADGRRLTASEDENPDLFWGLRGGGGNFGVVTSFEYRMHEIPPAVYSGLIVYPLEDGASVLRAWRDFLADQPEDLAVWAVLRKAPPLPFLPADQHGREIVALAVFYGGDPEEGERLAEPLLHLGRPVGQHLGAQPYADWQTAFDPLLTPGARNYWKSQDFTGLTDEALDEVVRGAATLPSPHCEVFIGQLGGAMSRVAPDATAYPHRASSFVVNLHGRWERPEEDAAGRAWARDMFDHLTPHATGGVYVNFLSEDETGRVRNAYGPNIERLVALKNAYDPGNLFRMNMNVRPSKAAA